MTMDKVLRFYVLGDFHDMAGMGVNAMRIPVPCWVFHDDIVINGDFLRTVLRLLDRAEGAGLKAILVLMGGTGEDVLGLGLLMEECREAPLPDNDDNNNKCDSAALRCAFDVNLLDSLQRDVLALFLVDNALLSMPTLTAAGRGRSDNAPLSSSSYDYYAMFILARFPPRELGVADGSKDDGGDNNDNACGASVTVCNLGIQPNEGLIVRIVPRTLLTTTTTTSDGAVSVRRRGGGGGGRGRRGGGRRGG